MQRMLTQICSAVIMMVTTSHRGQHNGSSDNNKNTTVNICHAVNLTSRNVDLTSKGVEVTLNKRSNIGPEACLQDQHDAKAITSTQAG